MISHHFSIYARITLAVLMTGVMGACTTYPYYAEPEPYYSSRAAFFYYWYYPAIGAYYDPHARDYYYYEDNHWIRARILPTYIRPYIGQYVIVRSSHHHPYKEHHRHRNLFQPERYRQTPPKHRHREHWIGAPHQTNPRHDSDDRRTKNHDRDRNKDKDRRHDPEPDMMTIPPHYRDPNEKYPRQIQDTRRDETSRHRESPVISSPEKPKKKRDSQDSRKAKSTTRYHGDKSNVEHGKSVPVTRQPDKFRSPDSREKIPKAPPKSAPSTERPPIKNDAKGHQHKNRQEDTQQRYRHRKDGSGDVSNEDDETLRKRRPRLYEENDQYR